MSIKGKLREAAASLIRNHGYEIVDARLLYDWQRAMGQQPAATSSNITDDERKYLHPSNPVLANLKKRYENCDPGVTSPLVWTEAHVSAADMLRFRGENAYVWQLRGLSMNPLAYTLATYYAKTIDNLRLLDTLFEDDAFGVFTIQVDGRTVSRDLLDSIFEIYFLERHLGLSSRQNLRILDIGAGYGRLAHRMTAAFSGIEAYLCADAFPTSTFLSEYYLNYRSVGDRAKVVPLDQIDAALEDKQVDLAINIHSFSECRPAAIEWWISRLVTAKVQHLMIVPNSGDAHDGSRLKTNDGVDFEPIVRKHGYRPVAVEPKFRDPVVQRYAINPTYHHLFELT